MKVVLAIAATIVVANIGASLLLWAKPYLFQSWEDGQNRYFLENRRILTRGFDERVWFDLPSTEAIDQMWREYFSAGPEFTSYVHFKSKPLLGDYYRVTKDGYRETRDPGPWPPRPDNYNVVFFGGSTSFGVGPHFATVASYLQEALKQAGERKVYVYNFGRSSYQNTQEKVLFSILLTDGIRPDLAVFLDGLNDFCFVDGKPSSWQLLERMYNEYHDDYVNRLRGNGQGVNWATLRDFGKSLPLVRLAEVVSARMFDPPRPRYQQAQAVAEPPPSDAIIRTVIDRYYANVRQIRAVAREFDVKTAFVWQPIPTYKYDTRYHPLMPDRLYCHVNSKYGYPVMRELLQTDPLGADFIWAADIQEDLKEPLYVDGFHYTAPMSRRIAEFIAAELRRREIVPQSPTVMSR